MKLLLLISFLIFSGCSLYHTRTNTLKSNHYIDKAVNYLRSGKPSLAEISIELASHYDPENPAVYDARGCLAFARGDYEIAESMFLKAIDISPNYHRAHYNLAQVKLFNSKPVQAYEIMKNLINIYPDDVEYRNFNKELLKINNFTESEIIKEKEYLEVIKSG